MTARKLVRTGSAALAVSAVFAALSIFIPINAVIQVVDLVVAGVGLAAGFSCLFMGYEEHTQR